MREKLIELIIQSVQGCARNWAETITDYLLQNGVVVLSEWGKKLIDDYADIVHGESAIRTSDLVDTIVETTRERSKTE